MKKAKTLALLVMGTFLFTAANASAAAGHEEMNSVRQGDSIPAFKGRNLNGDEVDVGALLGKKIVVLAFWSIYCKPCVEEMSSLIRLQDELGGDKLEVIGINTDSELGIGRIRKFMSRFEEFEKKQINYQTIFDEENKLSSLIGVSFLPTVLSINTKGQVEKILTGFEEKSEQEIFAGIRALLPSAEAPDAVVSDDQTFTVEAVVPMCGFYGPNGWVGSFTGNRDLDKEIEKVSAMARKKATKLILREAIASLGLNLAEDASEEECFRPFGVFLAEDPMKTKDSLTNLVNELPINRLVKTLETNEDFMGTEYSVTERATVKIDELNDLLERLGYRIPPRTISFSVVNIKKLDQRKFVQLLLEQSRYIGYFNFPTCTIYTTSEIFAEEMETMDLEGLRLFIEDTFEDRIELEVWR
jgi:peroxiredoxin